MTEVREDPHTGQHWRVIEERGSVLTLESIRSPGIRTVSYGTWITWPRIAAQPEPQGPDAA